ncbi:MAG: DUF2835 family protein [Ferrimonas sp.]
MTLRHTFSFSLNVPALRLQQYYRGQATHLNVSTHCGRQMQIHLRHLRPFVTSNGLSGHYQMTLDGQGQLLELVRLS